MKLNTYQENILKAKRNELLDEVITVVTVAYTGTQTDFMGASKTRTETTVAIDGKIGWEKVIEKDRETGGDVIIGDCRVLSSLDDKSKVDVENVYLKDSDNTKLEIVRIIPAYDTNECVVYCKRRE
jgi:hypothetical protein